VQCLLEWSWRIRRGQMETSQIRISNEIDDGRNDTYSRLEEAEAWDTTLLPYRLSEPPVALFSLYKRLPHGSSMFSAALPTEVHRVPAATTRFHALHASAITYLSFGDSYSLSTGT
jgi:hypothetical protein